MSSALLNQVTRDKGKWVEYMEKREETRYPKLAWKYEPTGTRDVGGRRKGWSYETEWEIGPVL